MKCMRMVKEGLGEMCHYCSLLLALILSIAVMATAQTAPISEGLSPDPDSNQHASADTFRAGGSAPLFVLLTIVAAEVTCRYLRRTLSAPKVPKEERQLADDIRRLRREAESLINPATFAQSAKLTRQANAKEKQLKQMVQNRRSATASAILSSVVPFILQGAARTALVTLFWERPVAQLPFGTAHPFAFLLAFPHGYKWQGGGAVSIIPWLFCVSQVSKSFLDYVGV